MDKKSFLLGCVAVPAVVVLGLAALISTCAVRVVQTSRGLGEQADAMVENWNRHDWDALWQSAAPALREGLERRAFDLTFAVNRVQLGEIAELGPARGFSRSITGAGDIARIERPARVESGELDGGFAFARTGGEWRWIGFTLGQWGVEYDEGGRVHTRAALTPEALQAEP